MINKWFLLFCFVCTTIWAFQDFYKKRWTPNERLSTGLLLALIVLSQIICFIKINTILGTYLSLFAIIAFTVVIILELAFDVRASKVQQHKK